MCQHQGEPCCGGCDCDCMNCQFPEYDNEPGDVSEEQSEYRREVGGLLDEFRQAERELR